MYVCVYERKNISLYVCMYDCMYLYLCMYVNQLLPWRGARCTQLAHRETTDPDCTLRKELKKKQV